MMNLRRSFTASLFLSLAASSWSCGSSSEDREQALDPSTPFTPGGAAGASGGSDPEQTPDDGNEGINPNLPLQPDGNAAGSGGTGSSNNPMMGGAALPAPIPPTLPDPDVFNGGPQTLRQAALEGSRLIGTAVRANRLNNTTYTTAAREFNYVTPENEMKFDALERQPGQFTFANADRIVQFAEANYMSIKGHTLIWHSQIPQWVRDMTTREQALEAMERHISTVVGRYAGRVHAWDVVNEAFTDGNAPRLRGSDPNDVNNANNANGNNGPDSPFRRLIGEDYIDRAFQLARAADPDALLFYNDFNTEGTSAKANAVFTMVQSMKQRGIPIDGVGLQMHINSGVDGNRSADQIRQNIQRLTALGLQVVYSELDVSLCGTADIATRRQQQRQRLADVTQVCVENPLCTAITFWGIADSDSWRDSECNGGRSEPLLFDSAYQHKDAYSGVFDQLVAGSAP
ncbi:MAG: Exoglucanase/xylanase [Pseudomonadota bacterium]